MASLPERGDPRPLGQILVSGGGRCNVTHHCFDPALLVQHYPRGGKALRGAFTRFQPQDTVAWYQRRGVRLKTEADGRMFPTTDRSQTIVDCLLNEARRAGVTIRTQTELRGVSRSNSGEYHLKFNSGESVVVSRLILATGGGSASGGLGVARDLGHQITPLFPSLFTFCIQDPRIKGLQGLSVPDAQVECPDAGLKESGPVLVTHWGLSGPGILKLSAWGAEALGRLNYRFPIRVNWSDSPNPSHMLERLQKSRKSQGNKTVINHSPLTLPRRLWERLVRHAGIEPATQWAQASRDQLKSLAEELTQGRFEVDGKSTHKDEFVTCGGVALHEVEMASLESKHCAGLHFAGEVLNVDGVTGGFNFQAAWTTGYLAGQAAGSACAPAAGL